MSSRFVALTLTLSTLALDPLPVHAIAALAIGAIIVGITVPSEHVATADRDLPVDSPVPIAHVAISVPIPVSIAIALIVSRMIAISPVTVMVAILRRSDSAQAEGTQAESGG
jgi:hypothetical protein